MPLYEYECDVCGHRFEIIQKFSDAPIETCPSCGGAVHKLQSAPAFQFRGSGWYVTDYAKKGQVKEAKSDSESPDQAKDKTEKADKTDKTDRADKTGRTDKGDKTGKTDRADRADSDKAGSPNTAAPSGTSASSRSSKDS